jgi:DHA1 family tetracycline resistance protein-like MFS transporter
VLGNLSDHFGRKPILMGSLAALSLDYLLMGFSQTIVWLFIGRLLSGIAGATFATANAVVADLTNPPERSRFFGLNGMAWGMGFIIGPVIGGLLGQYGPRVPFFAASLFAASNFVLALIFLRETLGPENRRAFSLKRANLIGSFRALRAIPAAFGLLGVLFLYQIGHDTIPATWAWVTRAKFGWTEREVGMSLSALGLGIAVVQGGLIRPVTRRLGERGAVYLGFICGALGYTGYALATSGMLLLLCIPLASMLGLAMPSVRAIMSRSVPPNAQGELQGALSGVVSFTAIVAPFAMTQLFHAATMPGASWQLPGAPFFGAGLALLLAAVLFKQAASSAPVSAQAR